MLKYLALPLKEYRVYNCLTSRGKQQNEKIENNYLNKDKKGEKKQRADSTEDFRNKSLYKVTININEVNVPIER